MKCKFVVGQRVGCIDDNWIPEHGTRCRDKTHPKLNKTYVITRIDLAWDGEVYLQLVGFKCWYWHVHFRALRKSKTDISEFKRMLVTAEFKSKVREPERV